MTRGAEATQVEIADKAAAVGRLLLGSLTDFRDFFAVSERDYPSLPRRALRSGRADVLRRLGPEIERFCAKNFEGMTALALARLYDDLADALRECGIAGIPLREFCTAYAPVSDAALRGAPPYATVVVSLRGLQFQFPEDQLSKDLIAAIDLLKMLSAGRARDRQHAQYVARQRDFAARSSVLAAFNLVEAFLAGLLWSVLDAKMVEVPSLPPAQRRICDDPCGATLRSKLEHVPAMASGRPFDVTGPPDRLLRFAKPFRDSLTHPSPFIAPERFGGYDKMEYFHLVDHMIALLVVNDAVETINRINQHLGRCTPPWLQEVVATLDSTAPSQLHREFSAVPLDPTEACGSSGLASDKGVGFPRFGPSVRSGRL
ncbi:MAG: hypothetical protein HOV80_35635 [Polyangiaceae bacterium]|nr:hypothetical protein [Polyangiaceae bacterium]